ncbi:unnamed protein product [Caenorhabditis brenneri]
MVPTFPLLQLPSNAIKIASEYCTTPELIFLSILSNRAKRLVKSSRRRASHFLIDLRSGCEAIFHRECVIYFGETDEADCDIESLTPCTLRMTFGSYFGPDTYFTLPGFGVREWFEHFSFIFDQPFVSVDFSFQKQRVYTLESVCKLLKGFLIGGLIVRENPCEVLRQLPVMGSLRLDKSRLEPELPEAELNFIKKVLIGNITRVEIRRAITLDLNTLLMMNSPRITSWRPSLSDKELNTFLKLWLTGGNPNLERLSLDYIFNFQRRRLTRTFNTNVILKGIGYQLLNDGEMIPSKPRYHVRKSDGTLALVLFGNNSFLLKVQSLQ